MTDLAPAHVLRVVSAVSGHSVEMLLGPRRTADLIPARHIACLLMQMYCPYSLTYLAGFMHRDRCTFRHGVKSAKERLGACDDYVNLYRKARASLFVESILEAAE